MNRQLKTTKITIHQSLPVLRSAIRFQADSGQVLLGKRHMLYENFIDVLEREHNKPKRKLEQISKYIIVNALLDDAGFETLHPNIAKSRGLAKTVMELMDEISEANITVDELKKVSGVFGKKSAKKLNILASLMKNYRELLDKKNFSDAIDKKNRIISLLENGYMFKALNGIKEIELKNIYKITELDFILIYNLSKSFAAQGGRINISLPYDPYRQDAFRFLEHIIRKFEHLGEYAANITLDFSFEKADFHSDDVKNFLKENLFREEHELYNIKKHPLDDSVIFMPADSINNEIKSMCRCIKSMLNSGTDPTNIAIAFRNSEKYRRMLIDECEKYSIPLHFSNGASAIASPLSHLLLSAFKITENGFSISAIMDLLASNFVNNKNLNSGRRHLDRNTMEVIAASAPLIDDETEIIEKSLKKFIERQKEEEKYGLREKAAIFLEMVSELRKILSPLTKSVQTAKNIKKALDNLFEKLDIKNNIVSLKAGDSREALDILRENLSVFEIFGKICENIKYSLEATSAKCSPLIYQNLLTESLKTARLPMNPSESGISVLNFEDLTDFKADYLFAAAVCEGEFPSLPYENILLSDDEKKIISLELQKFAQASKNSLKRKEMLTEKDLELLDDVTKRGPFVSRAMKYWEESFLFLRCLEAANKRIYLSWHRQDENGRAKMPSYFIEHAASLIEPPENPQTGNFMSQDSMDQTPMNAQDLLEFLAANGTKDYLRYVTDQHLKAKIEGICERSEAENTRTEDPSGIRFGRITDKKILAYAAKKGSSPMRAFSASVLEEYGHCPFAYFVKNILHCRKNGAANREMANTDTGTVIHEILEKYYQNPQNSPDDIEEIAAKVFAKIQDSANTGDERFWHITKNKITSTLKKWLKFETSADTMLRPAYFERKFGGKDGPDFYKDLYISGKWEKVFFQGSIDRIDISPGEFRIIDYKNSKGGIFYNKKLAAPGKKGIQLPLYRDAAMSLLKNSFPQTPAASSVYAFLKKRDYSKDPCAKEEFKEYFNHWDPSADTEDRPFFEKDLSDMIGKIRSGRFTPSGTDCQYCDFINVCRYNDRGEAD